MTDSRRVLRSARVPFRQVRAPPRPPGLSSAFPVPPSDLGSLPVMLTPDAAFYCTPWARSDRGARDRRPLGSELATRTACIPVRAEFANANVIASPRKLLVVRRVEFVDAQRRGGRLPPNPGGAMIGELDPGGF